MNDAAVRLAETREYKRPIGTYGHLAVFACATALALLSPVRILPFAASLCLLTSAVMYPAALRRVLNRRVIVFLTLLSLPPILWGEPGGVFLGISFSITGLWASVQMILRAVILLSAVNGLTSAVDIAAIAGLLERLGLRGLGFSMGVALNLLPTLQKECITTWHSLKMRGGLRKQRWRGLQLLLETIVTNALRHTDDITLAAESRAFSPERSCALPVHPGRYDWVFAIAGILLVLGALVI